MAVPGIFRSYVTRGGIQIDRTSEQLSCGDAIDPIVDALDHYAGVLLTSSYEYPGRYTRWDIGFVNPPVRITSQGQSFIITALNDRGNIMLLGLTPHLQGLDAIAHLEIEEDFIRGAVRNPQKHFAEDQRSRQFSIFSVLRTIIEIFAAPAEQHLGLYGAFGYDLAFQFEPAQFAQTRPSDRRDLVLFLPDELILVDHRRQMAHKYSYEFTVQDKSTSGMPRTGPAIAYQGQSRVAKTRDHAPGAFASLVNVAKEWFRRGDLFEVVPSQVFYEPCTAPPSIVFRRLRESNPSPYGTFMNLGDREYLVGASPEMYVRSDGRRVETCPISGTIARGADPIGDAEQILKLLNSEKDASELTMCTDVDRNDKARVCEPDSIRLLGRRQIELYSRVIHTVDHVEGVLREGFDPLDAFLSHAWAVTVTGAPKLWAMRFIENHEQSYRAWYGGAIGFLGFDGSVNTGLTLRTIRIKDGVAEIRAGATLLIDSDPASEEAETELKASAFLDVVRGPKRAANLKLAPRQQIASKKRVFLVDCEDSFVNTLAAYLNQAGAEVLTVRGRMSTQELEAWLLSYHPDLVFFSPGPGSPCDFDIPAKIEVAIRLGAPIFGVCLGLQGLVQYFGGQLGVLGHPVHGKASRIRVLGGRLLQGLPREFLAGRYHSLYAVRDSLPSTLEITAESEDGIVMAIEHKSLPVAAVQFHPESIMTLKDDIGLKLIGNLLDMFTRVSSSLPLAAGR